jgi:dTDP-4-amino-4,6-dideoxygalactose transaminase
LAKRRKNARQLTKTLQKNSRLILPFESKGQHHSWYLYTARLKEGMETERNKIVDELKKKGIGAEVYYINPVHQMPFYRENFRSAKLPETDKASKQVFS